MAHNQNYDWIKSRIDDVKGKTILIVGDVGLDEYVLGEVRRISPEAPVPIVEVNQEDRRMGLAANVAANVKALDSKPLLLGVVGADSSSSVLSELLEGQGISAKGLVVDDSRPTTRKLRVLAQTQQVVRVDYEKRRFLSATIEQKLIQEFSKSVESADVVVLQDYAKGVLTEKLCQTLIQLGRKHKKPVLVDPNRTTPLKFYKGASLIKPNRDEAFQLAGVSLDDQRHSDESIDQVGQQLLDLADCENLIITLGKQGMRIFADGKTQNIPTFARAVYDVTGAGDTVLASLATARGAGWDLEKSCVFANLAAGVVVGEWGCVTCSRQQVLDYIAKLR